MSEREFRRSSNASQNHVEDSVTPSVAKSEINVSDILDEIDLVLEENAEEFVKSFVQKGGQ